MSAATPNLEELPPAGLLRRVMAMIYDGLLVLAIVSLPALYLTSRFARFLGRLIPSVETSAIGAYAFHKRRGIVSGGTASANRPAEVRWRDGYGNIHYLLAEPLDKNETIPQGTDVLILRTKDKQARILSL